MKPAAPSERARYAIRMAVERAAQDKGCSVGNLFARLPNVGAKTIVEILKWLHLPDDGWEDRWIGQQRRAERAKRKKAACSA